MLSTRNKKHVNTTPCLTWSHPLAPQLGTLTSSSCTSLKGFRRGLRKARKGNSAPTSACPLMVIRPGWSLVLQFARERGQSRVQTLRNVTYHYKFSVPATSRAARRGDADASGFTCIRGFSHFPMLLDTISICLYVTSTYGFIPLPKGNAFPE